jgi:voltage-gated potassium channel
MKFAAAMMSMLAAPLTGGSRKAMIRLGAVFLMTVLLFAAGFQALMGMEGRQFSWWTAIYWTLVTMTTLGFGDIVFETDLGRMYSVLVLLTGALLILILLPFTFIQLVYVPWSRAMREARAPRELPEETSGHVILTGRGPMEEALIRRAVTAGVPYVLLVEDVEEAASLHDEGYQVMVGDLDEPATYRAVRAHQAAMLVTARSDQANTNVVFTYREVTDAALVVATANSEDAVDVLTLAGADRVLQFGHLLGSAFARRILAPTARSSVISTFENLVIAETSAAGTELVGRSLEELDLRARSGVSVVGIWDRGSLQLATPELRVDETSILVLAGTAEQLAAYDEAFGGDEAPDRDENGEPAPVVILGGGRVGRAVARSLAEAGTPSCVVDRLAERVAHLENHVVGDAEDLEILRLAGIEKAPAVVVTTHDDDTNIYLTLYCRRLRPDVEILGRVALDRNVTTMHRAGADFVLSYASTGSIETWNALRDDSTLLLAEGLVVFRVAVPDRLAGRSLRSTDILDRTGCSVIGLLQDGECVTNPDPDEPLPADGHLILIGDDDAEERFFRRYVSARPRSRLRRVLGNGRNDR